MVMGSRTNWDPKFLTDYAYTQQICTIEITEPVPVPRTVSFPVRECVVGRGNGSIEMLTMDKK
ncbi:hypothetical protein Prudu_003079 [Prunus dulcis]|uniref:Uncharacterized protein n=1 Tax=Prunus dulcis TaxID=3755 RepID=A0A4Y1QSB7_PRUDU|nr:hypothetical protein Prudu_003079 [Prunus dulcis]